MNSIGVVAQPDVRVVVVVDLSSALPRQLAAPVVVPGASSCAPLDRLISRRAAEAELFFCRSMQDSFSAVSMPILACKYYIHLEFCISKFSPPIS